MAQTVSDMTVADLEALIRKIVYEKNVNENPEYLSINSVMKRLDTKSIATAKARLKEWGVQKKKMGKLVRYDKKELAMAIERLNK